MFTTKFWAWGRFWDGFRVDLEADLRQTSDNVQNKSKNTSRSQTQYEQELEQSGIKNKNKGKNTSRCKVRVSVYD